MIDSTDWPRSNLLGGHFLKGCLVRLMALMTVMTPMMTVMTVMTMVKIMRIIIIVVILMMVLILVIMVTIILMTNWSWWPEMESRPVESTFVSPALPSAMAQPQRFVIKKKNARKNTKTNKIRRGTRETKGRKETKAKFHNDLQPRESYVVHRKVEHRHTHLAWKCIAPHTNTK